MKRDTRARRAGALTVLIVALACAAPPRLEAAGDLFPLAESQLMAGRREEALATYVEALTTLARAGAEEIAAGLPEAELALRRLAVLFRETGGAADALPALSAWSVERPGGDPTVAALARFHAAVATLAATGDIDSSREIATPLGFLEQWRVIGAFDNERGGGFGTAYGPEKELDLAATYDGKVRRVAWRPLPARPLLGIVDLDALFTPSDECLAYLVTFVRSSGTKDAALRFGSDEGYKVWVNGALAAAEDVERQRGFDQSVAGIRLADGWNSILFKVAESKGAWELQARLTAPSGAALEGVVEGAPETAELAVLAASFAAAAAAAGSAPGAGAVEPPVCHPGIDAELRRAIEAKPSDARLAYLRGSLLRDRKAHDASAHPDTELLRRAIEVDPAPPIYHWELGRSLERRTAIAAERDDNAWRAAMLEAESRGCALAAEALARYYLETFNNFTRAREHVDRALEIHPALASAILLRGEVRRRLGFPLSPELALRRALETAPRNVQVLLARARELGAAGKSAERLAILQGLVDRNHLDREAAYQRIDALVDLGRTDEAIAALEDARRLDPFGKQAIAKLAGLARGADDIDQAIRWTEIAVAIDPEDHDLHRGLGELHWELDRREQALAAWDRALELQPNLPGVRERVELLRSGLRRFEDDFRIDISERVAAALAAPVADRGGSPARILLDLRAIEVHRDGTTRQFEQHAVEILNDAGARRFDQYATFLSPGEEIVEFKKARVTRRDGSVADARLGRFGMDSSSGRAAVDLPPLGAGDVVEIELVREDLHQSFFGDYFGHSEIFQSDVDIAEKVFILRVPSERKFYFHHRNLDVEPEKREDAEGGKTTYAWRRQSVPRIEPEPAMPALSEVAPRLDISTFESWEAFSRWYHNLIRRQFESSPEIVAKVRELVSGKDSDIERIRAVYDFVVRDIRYNAWEFGVHGFKPYNASAVFARRFGDCKDKATLISVMLGDLGIASQPVLIRAETPRSDEDLSLPIVNHFNHCISHVPAAPGRPALFLDGTASFHRLEELPSMDRGAKVLVVEPEGARIRDIPWNAPEDLALTEEWIARVGEDGGAEIEIRLTARGDFAVYLRQAFEVEGGRQQALERQYSQRFAGARILRHDFSGLESTIDDVSASLVIAVPRFAEDSADGPSLPLPEDFFETARSFTAIAALESRRFDVLLGNPRRTSLRAVYELPPGRSVKSVPDPAKVEASFGKFELRSTVEGARLTIERLIEVTEPRVDVADYSQLREFATQIESLRQRRIALGRT